MKNILITGGSGLIGTALTRMFVAAGYSVSHLGRRNGTQGGIRSYEWDYKRNYLDPEAIAKADCIINLAGASVAGKRWSESYKNEIRESRILGTQLLADTLKKHPHSLKRIIQASAIGIYPQSHEAVLDEYAPAGTDFLAEVCADWENAARLIEKRLIPLTIIRIGVVLSAKGGFIPKVSAPIKYGAGAVLGNGKQLISWIHIDDLCNLFRFVVEHPEVTGIFNAVADHPVSNREMTRLLAKELNRPLLLPPVPEFALRVLFGELTDELLASHNLSNQKIREAGFSFQYTRADKALHNLLNHTKN